MLLLLIYWILGFVSGFFILDALCGGGLSIQDTTSKKSERDYPKSVHRSGADHVLYHECCLRLGLGLPWERDRFPATAQHNILIYVLCVRGCDTVAR